MRTTVRTIATFGPLAVALVLVAASCSIPLGDLGGPTSAAYGINEAGVIVGASEVPGSTPEARIERAFRRLPDGTMIELASPAGTAKAAATDINDAGEVAGWVEYTGPGPSDVVHVVRWDPDGTVHDLGLIGSVDATVRAIDEQGRIIGSTYLASGISKGYVYDPAVGHVVDLPDLPGGGNSVALGMNDVGDVVGYQWVAALAVPVRWDLDTWTATDLSPTWGRALLIDINDAGTIVGQARFDAPAPLDHTVEAAILRPGESSPTPLGTGSFSFPLSVNRDEVVAGWTTGPTRAFRWDSSTGVVPLTTGGDSFGWSINDHGQIVGTDTQRAVIFVAAPS